MNALIKDENTLIINSLSSSERVIIKQMIDNSAADNKEISFTELFDINGDTDGVRIEIKDIVAETVPAE